MASTADSARSRLGFRLAPAVHGDGYGTEAVSLLPDYLLGTYPHPAVYVTTLPADDASRGPLASLGLTREGPARSEAFRDGEYRDAVVDGPLGSGWR